MNGVGRGGGDNHITPSTDPNILIHDIAIHAAGELVLEVILELEKWNADPVVGKVREALIQALRNRIFGANFYQT